MYLDGIDESDELDKLNELGELGEYHLIYFFILYNFGIFEILIIIDMFPILNRSNISRKVKEHKGKSSPFVRIDEYRGTYRELDFVQL